GIAAILCLLTVRGHNQTIILHGGLWPHAANDPAVFMLHAPDASARRCNPLEHRSSNLWRRSPTPPPSGGRLDGGHSADRLARQGPHAPRLPPSSPPPAGGRLPARAMGKG